MKQHASLIIVSLFVVSGGWWPGLSAQEPALPPLPPAGEEMSTTPSPAATTSPTLAPANEAAEFPVMAQATPTGSPPAADPGTTRPVPAIPQLDAANPATISSTTAEVIEDSAVQPAVFQPPPGESRSIRSTTAGTSQAQTLVEELHQSVGPHHDSCRAMTLEEMLLRCERSAGRDMIRQYWLTWQACAEYRFAIDEQAWLDQLGSGHVASDTAVLDAARLMVRDEVREKKLVMEFQQHRLQEFQTGTVDPDLPWPVDAPLVGHYETHYGLYSSQGTSSRQLETLDRLIPQQEQLIHARAETVVQCRSAIMSSTRWYRQSGEGCATMLQALYLSRECHAAFVRSVADYNRTIATYALTIKPDQVQAGQVVAMLIPQSAEPVPGPTDNGGLRQATLPDNLRVAPLAPAGDLPSMPAAPAASPAAGLPTVGQPSVQPLNGFQPPVFQPPVFNGSPTGSPGPTTPLPPPPSGSTFRR